MKSQPPTPSQKAVTALKTQVAEWAVKIRVKPRQIRLQKMRRKWASCSTSGTVSFSTEVLSQPPAFREYVIVHELLHLKVPNHGKLFKTLLRAYLPDYDSIRPLPPLDSPVAGRSL
jgi:predicted metal-dependent hydrolase